MQCLTSVVGSVFVFGVRNPDDRNSREPLGGQRHVFWHIPNGPVIGVLSNGVPVAAVDIAYDQIGISWWRFIVGQLTGWSMVTSLSAEVPIDVRRNRSVHSQQEQPVARAGIPTPSVSPSELLGGCGRGRYRDPGTRTCRGPADVGR